MDRQLRKRLIHTVQHLVCTSRNGYGDKSFAPPISRQCFREGKITALRTRAGEEVESTQRLYFDGLLTVGSDDVFVFGGREYPVLSVNHYDGLKPGTGTTVVYL